MLKKVNLGSTGIQVSRLGLGTVKFGRNQQVQYPQPFQLPSDKEIIALLSCAQQLGINFLDTAPAYGNSEERLGQLLPGKRSEWIISTKVGEEFINGASQFDFSKQTICNSVARSLKRLRTDYLDLVLVHSNGEDKKIIETYEVFATLNELKKQGLIRAFGMSTKTLEGGLLAVQNSDVAMVTYNPLYTDDLPIIQLAHRQNKGILIKKALISGHLEKFASADPIKTTLQFILNEPGVSSVIVGTLNPEHLRVNVLAAQ